MNPEILKLLHQLALLGNVTYTDKIKKYLITESDTKEFQISSRHYSVSF